MRGDSLHLFYQTYGNGPKDAICHAVSADGVHFRRDASNPIFHPTGAWTVGRAIDAEVVPFDNQYFFYFATRDPAYKVQMQGVTTAPLGSSESGHPAIFQDPVSGRTYLFYQGNNDHGQTWHLSKVELCWRHDRPCVMR